MENEPLFDCHVGSCIRFGAYGSAWIWRSNVLSPGSLQACNLCTLKLVHVFYMFSKNIVQYQESICLWSVP